MAGITVRNLRDDLGFGSIVDGLSWDNIDDPAIRRQINDIFEDRGMIVFENVEPSQEMHVAISNIFGPLKDHPTKTTARVDQNSAPGVIDMHSRPREVVDDKRGLVEVNGKLIGRFSPWHFDHCYNDELNRAGVLRCLINAPDGTGRTGFADGVAIYRNFDPKLREKLENTNVIYTLDTRLSKMRFGRTFKDYGEGDEHMKTVIEAQTFPRAMHPAVWTRKSGEKVLHIGPWMSVGLEHHEDAEGEAFFEEACQELNRQADANSYWHDWKPTDMVIWDNWRMLHAVGGCDPKYERRMQRTTIKGDYGLGYFEDGKKIGEVFRELV